MNKKLFTVSGLIILAFIIALVADPTRFRNNRTPQVSPVYVSRLDVNATKVRNPNITELKKEILLETDRPDAKTADISDRVKVNYVGWIASSGTVFQSSFDFYEDGIEFNLNGVITGWSEGMVGMKEGEVVRLFIPSEKAYGATPPEGSNIPVNADLIFDVELIEIK